MYPTLIMLLNFL